MTAVLLRERFPRTVALALGLALSVCLVGALEGVFFVLNELSDVESHYEGGYKEGFFEADERLGYAPRGSTRVSARKVREGRVVYDVIYTIDSRRRRISGPGEDGIRDAFALFFGDSYTFGEGVDDDESMPWRFQELSPRYRAYNYGFSGYGPQQMLARLEDQGLAEEIEERDGFLVYLFLDGHEHRLIGSMQITTTWGRDMPYYVERDGRIERCGAFGTDRRMVQLLYDLIGASQTAKFFRVELPPEITEAHLEFTASAFAYAKRLFSERLGSEKFWVALFPGSERASRRLRPRLEARGIDVLDYSRLWERGEHVISGDGHPSAEAHEKIAGRILADVGDRVGGTRDPLRGSPRWLR